MTHPSPSVSPVYLDHNATTPIDPAVLQKLNLTLPRSSRTRRASSTSMVTRPRKPSSGPASKWRPRSAPNPRRLYSPGAAPRPTTSRSSVSAHANPDKKHLVTTQIEHPAVLEPMRSLERQGWQVTYLPVDETGRVSPDAVAAAITPETVLVSVMAANNEVGTLQPSQDHRSDMRRARSVVPYRFGASAGLRPGRCRKDRNSLG